MREVHGMRVGGGGLTVRFWGTRGSLPSPGQDTSVFGGNTSCVEVRAGGKLVVLDAGSGMRLLGRSLLSSMPIEAHVLFTHYHWDHIMGLPFFAPLFIGGNKLHLYGETKQGMDVLEILSGQMIKPYFPVSMDAECMSTMQAHPVAPDKTMKLGDLRVSCCRLCHPGDAVAYRLDYRGRSLVYATDHEHNEDDDKTLIDLAKGADILIYDSMYTDAEHEKHPGWGHSTWRAGVEIARAATVGQLVLFHHLPERSDEQVAALERSAKRAFSGAFAAREGMTLELPGKNRTKAKKNRTAGRTRARR